MSADRLSEAERQLGVELPLEYRTLLQTVGGGHLNADRVVPGTDESAILNEFYSIDHLVRAQHHGFREVIPHDYLAVGDGAGGAVCVTARGDEAGSVWWASYDEAELIGAQEPTEEIMHRLADNFDDLLAQVDQWAV